MTDEPESTNSTNRSGGTDLNAQGDVNVGGDAVGHDKIFQASMYIERVLIFQAAWWLK